MFSFLAERKSTPFILVNQAKVLRPIHSWSICQLTSIKYAYPNRNIVLFIPLACFTILYWNGKLNTRNNYCLKATEFYLWPLNPNAT